MRVLVTGGAGYVGTGLCQALLGLEEVESVTVYDNLSRHNFNLFIGVQKFDHRYHVIEGDILDSRNLRKAVAKADVVFHLAAKVTTPFADQDAHLFEQVNHWGTAEVTYAVEESDVKRLIYLSSVSVYGSGDMAKGIDAELNPKTFYGISKMRAEEHVRRLENKVKTTIVRCGNVYGYNRSMRFDAVINKLLFDANFHNKINIHGNGEQHRPFVFIDTVTSVLSNLINPDSVAGTFNLVEHNLSINDIVEVLRELYPEMEMIFINNNMKLRELKVDTSDGNLILDRSDVDLLRKRLAAFKKEFSF